MKRLSMDEKLTQRNKKISGGAASKNSIISANPRADRLL